MAVVVVFVVEAAAAVGTAVVAAGATVGLSAAASYAIAAASAAIVADSAFNDGRLLRESLRVLGDLDPTGIIDEYRVEIQQVLTIGSTLVVGYVLTTALAPVIQNSLAGMLGIDVSTATGIAAAGLKSVAGVIASAITGATLGLAYTGDFDFEISALSLAFAAVDIAFAFTDVGYLADYNEALDAARLETVDKVFESMQNDDILMSLAQARDTIATEVSLVSTEALQPTQWNNLLELAIENATIATVAAEFPMQDIVATLIKNSAIVKHAATFLSVMGSYSDVKAIEMLYGVMPLAANSGGFSTNAYMGGYLSEVLAAEAAERRNRSPIDVADIDTMAGSLLWHESQAGGIIHNATSVSDVGSKIFKYDTPEAYEGLQFSKAADSAYAGGPQYYSGAGDASFTFGFAS